MVEIKTLITYFFVIVTGRTLHGWLGHAFLTFTLPLCLWNWVKMTDKKSVVYNIISLLTRQWRHDKNSTDFRTRRGELPGVHRLMKNILLRSPSPFTFHRKCRFLLLESPFRYITFVSFLPWPLSRTILHIST